MSDSPSFTRTVGIDWGTQEHQVCVLTTATGATRQQAFAHSDDGLRNLLAWLAELAATPASAGVAIEVPCGPVVEALQAAGYAVFAINPKQLDRFRDRFSPAGAKDDARDAEVLALALANAADRRAFKHVPLPSPILFALRETSRLDQQFRADFRRAANQLRDILLRALPDLLALCPAADEPWLWDLLEQACAEDRLRALRPATVSDLLKRHRKRKVTAADLLAALKARPTAVLPGSLAAAFLRLRLMLPLLRTLHDSLASTHRELVRLVAQSGRLAVILDSHKGIDARIAAGMLAEVSQALEAADLHALRVIGGTAPVTRKSGKSLYTVRMRRAVNVRFRNLLRHWARTAARADPYSRDFYLNARARGLSHEQALRSLADSLLRCLVATIRSDSLYDPDRRSRGSTTVAA
jgi:transposase